MSRSLIWSTSGHRASVSSPSMSPPRLAASSMTSRAIQVGPWTPLVIDVIGTSASSKAGHRPLNMPRRHVAVQLGDAVGALGEAEAHHRHVEDAGLAAVVVLGAEREHPVDGDARASASCRRSTAATSSRGNRSMPAGTGVWVVKTVPARETSSAVSKSSARPGLVDGELADALDAEEARVALVGVEDLRRRGAGDARPDAQGAYAADAEEQLLAQPVLGVAAVEPVGDVAVVGAVLLDVGVEQQQRHAADVGDEDPGHQVGAVGQGDRDRRAACRRSRAAAVSGSSSGSRTG